MSRRKILVADLLCGAGGSSTGCMRALKAMGLEMELVCVNHWPVAIETHSKNHPHARHHVMDISTVRPHILVPEMYLDLLMASPTCTHHSVARGGKPTSDQQRSDPWHIITWLTELRVKRLIIENVWEFVGWGPVDPRTGKPIKSRKGEYFNAWIDTIRRLGFEPEWKKLNAADYGDATTRQRFILMARSDRKRLIWPVATHTKIDDSKLALFPGQKPWRAAREIIDWDIRGRSIITRPIPLAPKTLARILAGAIKFGWPQPFIDILFAAIERSLKFHLNRAFDHRNVKGKNRAQRRALVHDYVARLRHFRIAPLEFAKGGRSAEAMLITLRRNAHGRSVGLPIPTVAARGTHIALATPIVVSPRHGKEGAGPRPREVGLPLPTITAGGSQMAVAEPVIVKQNFRRDVQSVDAPAPTIMTQARLGLAEPVIVNMKGKSTVSDVDAPLPTQTSHAGHVGVAEPVVCGNRTNNTAKSVDDPVGGITTTTGGGQFLVEPVIMNGRKNNKAKAVSKDPIPTLDTKGGVWLAEPFVLAPGSSGAPRAVDQPLPTITTGGAGAEEREGCARPMMVEPMVVTVAHGNDAGEAAPNDRRAHSVDDPLGTIHAGGGKFGIAEPFVLSRHAGGAPRSVEEPTPTQVAKQSHVLISPYYGSGSGQTCKGADEPLDTLTSKNRFGMVVPVTHSQGGNAARDVEEPLPTMTTAKGGEFAMVMPVTHHDTSDRVRDPGEPLPTITTAKRGELAFIAAQFGEREGQAPRVHDIGQPTPAICATGHVNLVEATPHYDILFRMLEPHELAAAMGFDDEESKYEFAGTKTEQIKQIGNAVSVAKMKACVSAIMSDAAVPIAEPKPTRRAATA